VLDIETVHHVAVVVSNLARAKQFYGSFLGLTEIERPAFPFDGAWYSVGSRDLHLIVGSDPTFREGKGINSQDGHFAIRVKDFAQALAYLESHGYRVGHEDPFRAMRVSIGGPTRFPQVHFMDPDRNMIEINGPEDS
jgi:catechol 2,3-dioxygenase-like lactoylglutathione lyase family enzyme